MTSPCQEWAMMGDVHIDRRSLPDLKLSFAWKLQVMRNDMPDLKHVFVLGDTLHQRPVTGVDPLAAEAARIFFEQILDLPQQPILHVLIGNHDMMDRRSRAVHAFNDYKLRNGSTGSRIHVYDEITRIEVSHCHDASIMLPILMIPFHHDQQDIINYIDEHYHGENEGNGHRTVAMIHGAIKDKTASGYSEFNLSTKQNALEISVFEPFLATFLAHFHKHKTYYQRGGRTLDPTTAGGRPPGSGSITTLGSPIQHTAKEANDLRKGFVAYDPVANRFELKINPYASRFVKISYQQVDDLTAEFTPSLSMLINPFANKRIDIDIPPYYADNGGEYVSEAKIQFLVRKLEVGWGASKVVTHRRERIVPSIILDQITDTNMRLAGEDSDDENDNNDSDAADDTSSIYTTDTNTSIATSTMPDLEVFESEREMMKRLIHQYVDENFTEEMKKERGGITPATLLESMKGIIDGIECDDNRKTKSFVASIERLEIQNFLSLNYRLRLDLKNLPDGLWFIVGANGSGKSLLLEAICWCLFGKLVRNGTMVDDVYSENAQCRIDHPCFVAVTFSTGLIVERYRTPPNASGKIPSKVEMSIIKPDGYRVERGGKSTNTQQTLEEEYLGIDYDTWIRIASLSSSTTTNFNSSTPQEKRKIIEQLLGFDRLDKYMDELRRLKKEKDNDQEARDIKLKSMLDEIDKATWQIEQLTSTNETLMHARLNDLNKQIASFEQQLTAIRKKIKDAGIASKAHGQSLREAAALYTADKVREMKAQLEVSQLLLNKHREERIAQESAIKLISTQMLAYKDKIRNAQSSRQLIRTKGKMDESVDAQRLAITNHIPDIKAAGKSIKSVQTLCDRLVTHLQEESIKPLEQMMGVGQIRAKETDEEIQASIDKLEFALSVLDTKYQLMIGADKLTAAREITLAKEIVLLKSQLTFGETIRDVQFLSTQEQTLEAQLQLVTDERECLDDEELNEDEDEDDSELDDAENKVEKNKAAKLIVIRTNRSMIRANEKEIATKRELLRLTGSLVQSEERNLERIGKEVAVLQYWIDELGNHARNSANKFRSFAMKKQIVHLNRLLAANMHTLNYDEDPDNELQPQKMIVQLTENLEVVEIKISDNDQLLYANPHEAIPVMSKIAKRSAGQQKRAQLAMFLTLYSISQHRSQFQLQLLILDEVFDSLDREGQLAAQRWILNSRDSAIPGEVQINPHLSKSRLKHIFAISHSPHMINSDVAFQATGVGRILVKRTKTGGSRYFVESNDDINSSNANYSSSSLQDKVVHVLSTQSFDSIRHGQAMAKQNETHRVPVKYRWKKPNGTNIDDNDDTSSVASSSVASSSVASSVAFSLSSSIAPPMSTISSFSTASAASVKTKKKTKTARSSSKISMSMPAANKKTKRK